MADGHAEQSEPINCKARGDPRRTMRRSNSPKGNGLRGDITVKQQAPSQSRRQTPPVELASQWRVSTPHSGAEWKPYRIDKGEGQRACALGGVRCQGNGLWRVQRGALGASASGARGLRNVIRWHGVRCVLASSD